MVDAISPFNCLRCRRRLPPRRNRRTPARVLLTVVPAPNSGLLRRKPGPAGAARRRWPDLMGQPDRTQRWRAFFGTLPTPQRCSLLKAHAPQPSASAPSPSALRIEQGRVLAPAHLPLSPASAGLFLATIRRDGRCADDGNLPSPSDPLAPPPRWRGVFLGTSRTAGKVRCFSAACIRSVAFLS